jgi:hypothetical protein
MYLARFSYDVLPINRQRAIDFIRSEVEAARQTGLSARLLVPLTRSHGGAALQFEMGAWQSVGDDQAAVGTAISLLLAAMAGYQEVNRSRSVPLRVRVRVCRSR